MKGNDFEMNRKIKQTLSLLLAAVIFVGVMRMSTVPASAATNGHSQSEAMAWLNSKIGIFLFIFAKFLALYIPFKPPKKRL